MHHGDRCVQVDRSVLLRTFFFLVNESLDLGIDWGIDPKTAVLSDKDAAAPLLRETETPFAWEAPE